MATKNLGEILLEQGIIDREALDRALQLQGRRLGEILVQEHLADPIAVAQALKLQAKGRGAPRTSRRVVDVEALEAVLAGADRLEDSLGVAGFAASPEIQPALAAIRTSVEALLLERVATLEARARSIADQAAAEAGKRVDLHVECVDLALDRALVDDLADMLLHLVRNAVAHGIEPTAARAAANKPEAGRLALRVSFSSGRVNITVTDDGAGIDEDLVYAKAFERGILKTGRAETASRDILRALFTPGFSTLVSATKQSGRGVGLDVVEAGALRLGGTVEVESKLGAGSTFAVSVPVKFGRVSVVPLRAGSEWVAVSAEDIARIERTGTASTEPRASELFNAKPGAPHGPLPPYRVELSSGATWLFEEADAPQDAFVREMANGPQLTSGLLGGARLRDGRMMLWVQPSVWSSTSASR